MSERVDEYLLDTNHAVVEHTMKRPTTVQTRTRCKRQAKRRAPRRGSPEALRPFFGAWSGDPAEIDRLLAEIQAMRDADVPVA